MSEPVLTISDLSVAFRGEQGEVRAVDQVDLTLAAGETLGVVGESGSGKSTIALAIMGLLPRAGRVLGGRALFAGSDLLTLKDRALRAIRGKRIAMIFQDPMTSLNPYLRIETQLCEGMQEHLKLSRDDARKRALELLQQVGIPDAASRLRRYPHEFSGGQRQRIMIALALSCEPELLIADEPTTALDVTVQAQILALLKQLQRDRGLSMILVSHDLGVIAGMCDHVAVMHRGKLVEAEHVDALFAAPQHAYTKSLLAAVPRLDSPRGQHLATIRYDDAEGEA